MYMEEIFQELVLSVGISVAVCCMIMKLKPYGSDGSEMVGCYGQMSEEQELSFGSSKNRGDWPFAEFFDQLSVDRFYESNVIGHGEIASELVEDEGMELQDLSIEKEIVGGEKSLCLSQESSNVVDGIRVVSDIVEDVEVFEKLRREEDVDGCTERLSIHEIEENSHNSVEENTLRFNEIEIKDEFKRLEDEKTEKAIFDEIEKGVYEDEGVIEPSLTKVGPILGVDDEQSEDRVDKDEEQAEEEEGLFDDWEGVERTGLEKLFGDAVVFVGSKSNAGLIDRDMKIELYGLHKIAIEGPCRGAQPMALNVSARAKWVSWKRLGNMRRELAMERYILLLSERVPSWKTSKLQV